MLRIALRAAKGVPRAQRPIRSSISFRSWRRSFLFHLSLKSKQAWDLCFPRIFMVLMSLCRSWSSKLYFQAKSLISGSNKSFP